MERNIESERLKELMRKHLKEKFPLFDKAHSVDTCQFEDGKFWIGHRTTTGNTLVGTTHFDLNIERDICYLLYIESEKERHGRGLGWMLYEAVHNFAREAGCRAVRCAPSGGVFIDGKMVKSRRKYLEEHGYVPFNDTEMEIVL